MMKRRKFLNTAAAAVSGFTILPGHVISGLGHTAPSDKLNIAGVGIGGKGNENLRNMDSENVVALCDVDWKYAGKVFERYPKAKRYKDFRRMYDEMGDSIDAVMIATPDHTHCIAAAEAMIRDKHVYVQKPLTHSIYESRLLEKLAVRHRIATQMGNEGASDDDSAKVTEWIRNGEIGEIRKVEAFTDRPIWPQGLNPFTVAEEIPATLDWDLFIGPARMRPYHSGYTPWNWRGWWDFGTGALGDMACHILDPVMRSLYLTHPIRLQGSSTLLLEESAPNAEIVKYVFPARHDRDTDRMKYPEVEVVWYDGGLQPLKPEGWPEGKELLTYGGGVIFHGTKDVLVCGSAGSDPWLLSGRVPEVPQSVRRVGQSHEMDWVRACKEDKDTRTAPKSDFSIACPLNEMVLLGVPAIRLKSLNRELEWDPEGMKFTNIYPEDKIKMQLSSDFSIVDGDPRFEDEWGEEISALAFSQELIRHTYREGWTLPEMP